MLSVRTLEQQLGDTGARMTDEPDDFVEQVCEREGDIHVVDTAAKMIAGSARSMGLTVEA